MMLPTSVLFSLLLLSCSLLQDSSATSLPSNKKNGFYNSVIGTICLDSESHSVNSECRKCLTSLINKKTLTTTEIPKAKITELKDCMENVPEEFKEFRCGLETNSSYHLSDFVDKLCFDKLQASSPFIDLGNADLSKSKSNPGYFGLGELTGLTLAGIIKHFKLIKQRQTIAGSETQDFCTSFQESGFFTALSQAYGKSWKSNFEKRTNLFFDVVNKFACKDNSRCNKCLKTFLNAETVSAKEIKSKTFNELIECKETLSTDFKTFKKVSQKLIFKDRIPKSCLADLQLKEKSFKYEANVNITDLGKNTYFHQEVLKFGITTVFFYLFRHKDELSVDMISGLCDTVVRPYVRSFTYAMPSLHDDGHHLEDLTAHPYGKLINRTCEDSRICKACYKKITSLIDIKRPREVSADDMKVLKHCNGFLPAEFKTFATELEDTTFQACMKNEDAYTKLIKGYPMNAETDIKSSPALPHFSNFKKYLEFLFNGVCYYYKDESETDVKLAEKMHEMDLPGAFLFAIPATNEYDTRGCPREDQYA